MFHSYIFFFLSLFSPYPLLPYHNHVSKFTLWYILWPYKHLWRLCYFHFTHQFVNGRNLKCKASVFMKMMYWWFPFSEPNMCTISYKMICIFPPCYFFSPLNFFFKLTLLFFQTKLNDKNIVICRTFQPCNRRLRLMGVCVCNLTIHKSQINN
jgi:hypothetical protein